MLRDPYMERARELAERGRYSVAPNPLVGAVVVRDGEVVGEGWHVRAGRDHAETIALQKAGAAARDATMYVTLEPCNYRSNSSGESCTEAIPRSGIRKVVVGHLDPNPKMNGRSIGMLKEAGLEVELLNSPEFERQNEQWFWTQRVGRPFVHLKLAATLDGRIATANGDSKWVTGEEARRKAHLLRAEAGAVLVGVNTVIADDPLLIPRDLPQEPSRVTRVVLDPQLRTPIESHLVQTAGEAAVLIFTNATTDKDRRRKLEASGVEIIATPNSAGRLDLSFILDELGRKGISGVLIEGGGETARGFVRGGLVNKLTIFYAPKLLGSEGIPMIGSLSLEKMADAPRFSVSNVERFGEDVAITLYPSKIKEGYVHRVG